MAFKLSDYGGVGTGALGTVTNPSGQINTYANVTALSGNTITIGTPSAGAYETLAVGAEVMVHVAAITSGTDLQYLGNYIIATITAVNGSTLTLSKDVSGLVDSGVFANHHVQVLTVAQFDTLNQTISIAPLAYSVTNKYGGILAFKTKTVYNVSGSAAINLVAKGIPIANVAYRPATAQEGNASQIAWENHITARKLYLNCPDGAVFFIGNALAQTGTAARIGGTTAGVALYPYNGGSVSNTAVKGGPTILMAAQTITGFDPSLISKTSSNTSGSGLGRCYIATDTKLNADEGLYSLDCISNTARLAGLGIKDFGTGSLGTVLSLSGQVNSYAPVTAISDDGKTLTIGTVSAGVYEQFVAGNRIVFHVSRQTGSDNLYLGKFIQAKILSVSGSTVVLDTPVTNVVLPNVLSNYKCQIITVAQFDTLALSASYTGTKAYDDTAGCGGLLVMAAKSLLDLQSGQLNVEGKGILSPIIACASGSGVPASSISRPAALWQCSGHQGDCLPLSQGSGAVLLVSSKIRMNNSTIIGCSVRGDVYCGSPTNGVVGATVNHGGDNGTVTGYAGKVGSTSSLFKLGAGGDGGSSTGITTGYGHGGAEKVPSFGACGNSGGPGQGYDGWGHEQGGSSLAGASIFIVADTIEGFNVGAISTGGVSIGGRTGSGGTPWGQAVSSYGGCGYPSSGAGGGGGVGSCHDGGSGGASGSPAGTCFIYANTITNPDYTAVVAS